MKFKTVVWIAIITIILNVSVLFYGFHRQEKIAIKTRAQALKEYLKKQERLKYIVLDRDMVIRKGQKDAPGIKGYSMFLTKGARIYFKKE